MSTGTGECACDCTSTMATANATDSGEPRLFLRPDLGRTPTILTVIILPACILAFFLVGCVIVRRQKQAVQKSSPTLTNAVLVGALLTCGSALLWAHDDTVIAELISGNKACNIGELGFESANDVAGCGGCLLRFWLTILGLTVLWGSIAAKLTRAWLYCTASDRGISAFNHSPLAATRRLLCVLLALVLVQAAGLGLWSWLDPPRLAHVSYPATSDAKARPAHQVCWSPTLVRYCL
jgi:uncharacterized protein YneF (UPF0154 family)